MRAELGLLPQYYIQRFPENQVILPEYCVGFLPENCHSKNWGGGGRCCPPQPPPRIPITRRKLNRFITNPCFSLKAKGFVVSTCLTSWISCLIDIAKVFASFYGYGPLGLSPNKIIKLLFGVTNNKDRNWIFSFMLLCSGAGSIIIGYRQLSSNVIL